MRFVLQEDENKYFIKDPEKRFKLIIERYPQKDPAIEVIFHDYSTDCNITGRGLEEYVDEETQKCILGNIPFSPYWQYVEVGAGLGEFIPHIVRTFNRELKHKPIIIDPLDYEFIRAMLEYASKQNLDCFNRKIPEKIKKMLERCNLVLDNSRVNLINLTLGKALAKHKWLERSGDFVFECAAISIYGHTESFRHSEYYQEALELEKRLVKPNGTLMMNGKIVMN